MVKLLIDDKEIKADEGKTLLNTCLDNEIYIPNLCHIEEMESPPVSCRLCFVEIEGEERPVASCAVKVKEGMIVKTDTPAVRRLQRSAFQFLMSVHDVDCAHCPSNKKCELQRIAKFLKIGLKPKRLSQRLKEPPIVQDHPFLTYHPNRCVLCGKCVFVCQRLNGGSILSFAKRGLETVISFYGHTDQETLDCEKCRACVTICPVSAITFHNNP
ncbi:MAG: 2Fe-2S iron-sulfur cluster-binding protein [Desulfatiglans sp.]|jgi:NADH dehydrogenase/NADH:ubiquinone oxidoreductase subunit G|nr:2Fe-2S iron-sulfur cluster-binding protein [Thermodesulfobacteriota bacterium]MEE4353742.1 2Fe-2S iron-sulfur cluster-binding protein [Desulfatiglans sp.]